MTTRAARLKREAGRIGRFSVTGVANTAVDMAVFATMTFAVGLAPVPSNLIAYGAGVTNSYLMNRYWTFRHRGRTSFHREYLLFFVLNGVGLAISVGCLWFSHYALGLTGPLADNISANVVGLALGTMFRFWSYRRWVFPEDVETAEDAAIHTSV